MISKNNKFSTYLTFYMDVGESLKVRLSWAQIMIRGEGGPKRRWVIDWASDGQIDGLTAASQTV